MRKRFASLVALMLALMLVLTACGSKTDAPAAASTPAANKGPVTITFWVLDSFTKDPNGPLFKAIDQFQQANANIKVEVQPMAANAIHDKLVTSINGGEGPDVFNTDLAWMGEFAGMGLMQDITAQVSPIKGDYFDGPMAAMQYNNKFYAVPWYTNNVAVYYNKDAFAKAGITQFPQTWDQFTDAAKKLKAAGYYALSAAHGGFGTYFLMSFIFQNQGQVYSADGKKLTLDNPAVVDAFKWYTGLYTDLKAMPESVKSAFSWDEVYAPFIQGKAAMFIGGDWAKGTIDKNAPNIKYDIAMLPKGKVNATVAGGYNLAIGKNSKNADAAWKLIQFLTGKDGEAMMEAYGRIPARKDVTNSDWAKKDPFAGLFIQQAQYGVPQPAYPSWPKVSDVIGEAFDAVIQGQKSPEQALKDAQAKAQPIVDSTNK
ncbi:MAG: ABC transporter substrate-binding protein [Mycobacterium leprae]